MLEWADRRAWSAPSSADARPLPPETLLAKVVEAQPGAAPTGVTLRADRSRACDGHPRGQQVAARRSLHRRASSANRRRGLRDFFRTMTAWHRYLALEGASRATGKSVTGAANLAFLFIVLSGIYLWLPRVWTWIQFKNVLWFRGGLAAEGARLQLAQRDRHLVGHSARDRRRRAPCRSPIRGPATSSTAWSARRRRRPRRLRAAGRARAEGAVSRRAS